MADPLTLVILVASGQAHDAGTEAVARATREALGPETVVEVRETAGTPTDTDAIQVDTSAHADAVVEVRWNDARHDQAALHVLVARTARWVYRTIGFGPSDLVAERGRTLGFAVASMLPQGGLRPTPTPTPTPTANATPNATETPSADGEFEHERSTRVQQGPGPRVLVDVVAVGTLGLGGSAEALGAGAAAQWFAMPAVALRIGAGALGGTVSEAEATTLYLFGTAGVALHAVRARAGRPFGLALRVDYVAMRQSMSRLSSATSSPSGYDRWLSGGEGVVEGDWLFAPDVELVLGVGLADVFAPTYVDLQGTNVATIPPLRGMGEAGFRLRF